MTPRSFDNGRIAWTGGVVGGVALLVASPALFASLGWSAGGRALDPLLSLCLAGRPVAGPQALSSAWSFAPQIILPMLVALGLYARGAAASTGTGHRSGPTAAEASCFAAGMALLAVALVSPLCRLAATTASAHMVQHILIVGLAPPLIVLGRPLATMSAGLPARWRESLPRQHAIPSWLATPGSIALAYAAAIWLSHAPALYEAALVSPTVHLALLAFQLTASLLFWDVQVRAARRPETGNAGNAVLVALFTFMHTGLLGALLTFAGSPWYPLFGAGPEAWGLTAMEDQQLAGLIMWVPMAAIYLAAGLAVVAGLLKPAQDRAD